MLRHNFLDPNFIGHSQKYPYKLINYIVNYIGPPQIFRTCYPNTSHKLPKYFTMLLPNLGLQKYFSHHYQNWVTKFCHLYKSPNSFTLLAKPKKPNKTLLKVRCYTVPLKPVVTWHLKVCCYTTSLKPVVTRHPKVRCYMTLL